MRSQRVVIGMSLLGLSGLTVYGGVTGRLAPMLGAVFAPDTLTTPETQPHPSVVERFFQVPSIPLAPSGPIWDWLNRHTPKVIG